MTKLGDDDKQGIAQTIDEEVLKRRRDRVPLDRRRAGRRAGPAPRSKASSSSPAPPDRSSSSCNLTDDGHLTGEATVTQSDWGIKPYSTLFGALKVADEVKVTVAAELPV